MKPETCQAIRAENKRLKLKLEQIQQAMKLANQLLIHRQYHEWFAVPLKPEQKKAILENEAKTDKWLDQLFDGDRTNVKPDKSYDVEAMIEDREALPGISMYLVRGHYEDDETGTTITNFWALIPA